jgi:hypothetical protein
MHRGYKVVSVTPAGRKKYLRILHSYLIKCRHIIDGHVFWVHTKEPEDIEYMQSLVNEYPDFYSMQYLPNHDEITFDNVKNQIFRFFDYTKDPNTIYVRFDDDIVFIDVDTLQNFIDFRIDNPDNFVVFANIINNGLCMKLLQSRRVLNSLLPPLEMRFDNQSWGNWIFAYITHKDFYMDVKSGFLDKYRYHHANLPELSYVSINCFAFFGRDFKNFNYDFEYKDFTMTENGKEYYPDEEVWISVLKPERIKKFNAIYGGFVVSHFAFGVQRMLLEATEDNICLRLYEDLAGLKE